MVLVAIVGILLQEKEPSVKGDSLGLWLAQLRYDDEAARIESLEAIEAIGEPAIAILLDNLESHHDTMRISAAWVLGRMRPTPPGAAEALKGLAESPDEEVKEAARQALHCIEHGWPEEEPKAADKPDKSQAEKTMTAEEIIVGFRTTGSGMVVVRERAIEALRGFPHPDRVLPALLKELEGENAFWAVEALGALGDSRACGPLTAIAKDRTNLQWKRCLVALGQIGDKRSLPFVMSHLSYRGPYESYVDTAIAAFGDTAVPALIRELKKPKAQVERLVEILGRTRAPSAVPVFAEMLKSEDEDLRYCAAKNIHYLDELDILPLLREGYANPDSGVWVRRCMVRNMGAFGKETLPDVILATGDTGGDDGDMVAKEAREQLAKIVGEDPSCCPLLIQHLTHDNSNVRWAMIWPLGKIGDRSAVGPLVEAMRRDKDKDVRVAAARALGNIGESAAVEGLSQALRRDEDDDVKIAAAEALTRIPHRKAYKAMMDALGETDCFAAEARLLNKFGELGDPYSVPAIMGVLVIKTESGGNALNGNATGALYHISGKRMEGAWMEQAAGWRRWYRENW